MALGAYNSQPHAAATLFRIDNGSIGTPVAIPGGDNLLPFYMSCSSETDCMILGVPIPLGSQGGAIVTVTNGAPSGPVSIGGSSFFPLQLGCFGQKCIVVGGEFGSRQFAYVIVDHGVPGPEVIPDLGGENVNAIFSAGSFGGTCTVGGCLLTATTQPAGTLTALVAMVDGTSDHVIHRQSNAVVGPVRCTTIDHCLAIYGVPSQGANVASITPAGFGTPSPLTNMNVTLQLACTNDLGSCLATGSNGHGAVWPIANGVAGPADARSDLALIGGAACQANGCTALGYANGGGFAPYSKAVLVTGIPLPQPSDSTAPQALITSPSADQQLLVDEQVPLHFSCDDAGGSGIASCTATVDASSIAEGDSVPSTVAGDHTINVATTDNAGNHSSASVTYRVVPGSKAQTVTGGGTVSTGADASPEVPVQTQIVVPADRSGTFTVEPQATSDPSPSGFEFFDQQVVLSGPASTPSDPYEVTFRVDASQLAGQAPADVEVFRDGARVVGCTDPAAAVPDPCVASRGFAPDHSGDAVITVRTSHFSTWSFGLRTKALGTADVYAAPEALSLHVPASQGVLVNDLPADSSDVLTAGSLGGSAASRVVLQPDGSFSYVPPSATFTGIDSFTYVAHETGGRDSDPITVSILVTPRVATSLKVDPVVLDLARPLSITLGTVSAHLVDAYRQPVANQGITFTTNGKVLCTARTGADGTATCAYALTSVTSILGGVTATYDGNGIYFGSTGKAGIVGRT